MPKSQNISRISKIKIYKTVVKPYVIYGVELWTLTKKDENILAIWEGKILHRIYGPNCEESHSPSWTLGP
jgi:hypothetical protein